jgi:predicted aspartyl protease
MPFLTFPIGTGGVFVDIYVALSTPRIDVLKALNMSYPSPMRARALIDTGAGISGISPQIAGALGLVPSGIMPIISATTGGAAHNCNLYDVCLAFVQPSVKVLGVNIPVFEVDLFTLGVDVLLGRDVLSQCLCIYDGMHSTFILAF